jgi:DNA-binding LacI/PurR family transcriptional regulator
MLSGGDEGVQMSAGSRSRPTIYDVAQRAGVSKSLVSLVLQDSSRVSDARRSAVLAAIEELGYRPSRAAAVLASNRTRSIGVVIDDYRNLWFVGLLQGMHGVLSTHGYSVTVTDSTLNAHLGRSGVDGLLAMHVDGLVLAVEPSEGMLTIDQVPVVVAGWRDAIPPGADLVAADDEAGGRLATAHLLDLGHRAVGHLTGAGGAAARRRTGYAALMQEAGLRPRVAGEAGGTTEEDGYRAARELLSRSPSVTAVFAANDTMALGALAATREAGLAVPGDVSVIGYDNSPLARSRYLNLTSVDARSELVGDRVATGLLARIDGASSPPDRTLLEPALVVGSTTARAPVRPDVSATP